MIYGTMVTEQEIVNEKEIIVQPIWILVSVAPYAVPGEYSGEIKVTLDHKTELSLTLELLILSLVRKESDSYYLNLWQYPYASAAYYHLTPFSDEHLAIMEHIMEPYRRAGGNIGTASIVEEPWYHQTYCDYPSMVGWKLEKGVWEFDYHDFDIWAEFLLERMKIPYIECYSIVPWNNTLFYWENDSLKSKVLEPGSEAWENVWGAFLASFVEHLDTRGWFDHIIISMDERPIPEMEAALNLIGQVKNAEGFSLKTGGAVEHYDEKIWDRLFTVTPHISTISQKGIPASLFRQIAWNGEKRECLQACTV